MFLWICHGCFFVVGFVGGWDRWWLCCSLSHLTDNTKLCCRFCVWRAGTQNNESYYGSSIVNSKHAKAFETDFDSVENVFPSCWSAVPFGASQRSLFIETQLSNRMLVAAAFLSLSLVDWSRRRALLDSHSNPILHLVSSICGRIITLARQKDMVNRNNSTTNVSIV